MTPNNMVQAKFAQFFEKNGLPTQACSEYLVAVSGGLDSMVLAHLFLRAAIPFRIVHVNFGLRGAESDADQDFVSQFAQKNKIHFDTQMLDAKTASAQASISVQMAARNLRYAFFERLRQIHALDFVATAHHENDAIETALYHFSRGTGLSGLSGIPAIIGTIIRPLLATTRAEIWAYAQENHIAWREDSSNAKTDYTRNQIRHHIIPRFEEINPSFIATATRNLSNIKKANHNYQWFLSQYLNQHLNTSNAERTTLDIATLKLLPEPIELIRHWLSSYGFDDELCQQIDQKLEQTGWSCTADEHTLYIDRGQIILVGKQIQLPEARLIQADDIMVRLENGDSIILTSPGLLTDLRTEADTILVKKSLLQFPLSLRPWHEGDSFQPFGMQGQSQKVQDFLVNKKISVPDKSKLRILVNADGQIIWLVGLRFDHRFRAQSTEDAITKITFVSK
jgi:tRNA(Ile)-lysidine synthase